MRSGDILKKKDLTGMRFGRLKVLYETEPRYTSRGCPKVMWHCICDCGNEIDVHSTSLLSERTRSCGCYNRDMAKERMKKMRYQRNQYDLSGDYGIGYTSDGREFWFDLEDYEKIKDYCWFIHHTNYVACKDKTHKWMLLHKLIMNDLDNEYDVDHIKTEYKFDNRKCNLRIVTRSQNNSNRKISSINISGCTGVLWHSRDKIWEAYIGKGNKKYYLGRYDSFEDAVRARKEAEEKYYKEWSYDNSQKAYEEANAICQCLKQIK